MGNGGKGKKRGRLLHAPILAHYAQAQWGIIMQLGKILWRLVFCKFRSKRLAGERGVLCINGIGKWGTGTESFSRTGYSIVSH